jgi:predicted esterase
MVRYSVGSLISILLAGSCLAQAERYELGQRLKAFEAAWDQQTNAAARKKALAGVGKVTQQFFSFQLGEAGRTLDDARFALTTNVEPSDDLKWATSLFPDVPKRLIAGSEELAMNLKSFYTMKAKRPNNLTVRLTLGTGKPVVVTPEKLPLKVSVPLPTSGDVKRREDLLLTMDILLDAKPILTRTVGVSIIDGAGETFPMADQLLTDQKALGGTPTLESASVRERANLLKDLANGTVAETDIPAAKRLTEACEMLAAQREAKQYFNTSRTGDQWVTVPTGEERTACRLFVPKGLDSKKPVPLVVAMHGAGGSENLFFEGYGAGQIVKLCEKRGWLLVAPRAGLGFGLGGAVPVGEIIDKLAERYPIDLKNLFIVGHSMGAAMTVDAVQKYPGKFAAAAMLGGGGRVRKPELFAELPVFVGVGDQDFALRNAKALKTALTDAKAKKLTFQIYPDVEHLLIVREALGDVLDLFDKLNRR